MKKFIEKKPIGYLENKIEQKIKKDSISKGINCLEDFIINYIDDKNIKIYDRNCDHLNGKIISKNGKHICPLHLWEFDPYLGLYKNGIKKKSLKYDIQNEYFSFFKTEKKPFITKTDKSLDLKIRFINHAFLIIETSEFKFATDPWALGDAFHTGWWLKYESNKNWQEDLNNCDFIFISHNHSDHLHEETLSHINKEIPIVTPSFITGSTYYFLKELGFENIFLAKLNYEYNLKSTNLIFSAIKSSDFREDSALFFSYGKFSALLLVDCNNIFGGHIPQVDLIASSFAGGSTGFPLVFENYDYNQKLKILRSQKNSFSFFRKKILSVSKPKYFLPYAGFFQENKFSDKNIQSINFKNSIEEYDSFCNQNNILILNPLQNNQFNFFGSFLKSKVKNHLTEFEISKKEYSLKNNKLKVDSKMLETVIREYFYNSDYYKDLRLIISISDNNYNLSEQNFHIQFYELKKPLIRKKNKKFTNNFTMKSSNKFLQIKVRRNILFKVLFNKFPLEDLVIGFQCRIYRNPNIYNSHFWYHFSNIYVSRSYSKQSSNCNSCELVNQYLFS